VVVIAVVAMSVVDVAIVLDAVTSGGEHEGNSSSFSLEVTALNVVVVTVGVEDDFDIVDDVVEVFARVVRLGEISASAHTSIDDVCVSFARFSSVGFESARGNVHIDGFKLSTFDVSMLNGFVIVELTTVVVVVVSKAFEISAGDTVGGGGVQIELDEQGNDDGPVVVVVNCTGGDVDELEFNELFVVMVVDVVDDVVEFAARSRPPVFCCCSR
jgi:hypothetical protein